MERDEEKLSFLLQLTFSLGEKEWCMVGCLMRSKVGMLYGSIDIKIYSEIKQKARVGEFAVKLRQL